MYKKIIGEILFRIRRQNECTKEFMADILGMSRKTYSRCEEGKRDITFEELSLFLSYFSISFNTFQNELSEKLITGQINELDKMIEELLEEVKGKISLCEEKYNEKMEDINSYIDQNDIQLSYRQEELLDILSSIHSYKVSGDLKSLLYHIKNYEERIFNDYYLLNLMIPILESDDLIEIFFTYKNRKIWNNNEAPKRKLILYSNILSKLVDNNCRNNKVLTEIIEAIQQGLIELPGINILILVFRNLSMINFRDEGEKYKNILIWWLEDFGYTDVLMQIRKENKL